MAAFHVKGIGDRWGDIDCLYVGSVNDALLLPWESDEERYESYASDVVFGEGSIFVSDFKIDAVVSNEGNDAVVE